MRKRPPRARYEVVQEKYSKDPEDKPKKRGILGIKEETPQLRVRPWDGRVKNGFSVRRFVTLCRSPKGVEDPRYL